MIGESSHRRPLNIWPGFVDALAALLMVMVFVLMLFTIGQFVLSDSLRGKNRALSQLEIDLASLSEMLSVAERRSERLSDDLATTTTERDQAQLKLNESIAALNTRIDEIEGLRTDVNALMNLRDQLQAEVVDLAASLNASQQQTAVATELSTEAQAQVVLLNRQLSGLREQLTRVSNALEIATSDVADRDAEIAELGKRLNLALADKVEELTAYRSDFFGQLKQALGDNPNLRVEGDRFVFQSELLFESASATLGTAGRQQVQKLVEVLLEVSDDIPADIDWILRIDGHTDERPISSPDFPSNWELSTARALAIVKYMIQLGIEPRRLAPTGFGPYHPLMRGQTDTAFAANRRIEIKLTSR